ncbi:MAG: DnaJ domain-containing protein [Tissierellia bacterium]|nr:DnaJ domain-containing protein [Tissierellia bacterium]
MKKAFGHILRGLAKLLDGFFGVLITIFTFLVNISQRIKQIIYSVLFLGCFFVFLSPILLAFLLDPVILTGILFFVIFPLLGTILLSFLKYQQYVLTEFLYDKAEDLISDKKSNRSYADYGQNYRRMQEENQRERQRREQDERRRAEQEMWEQVFKEFFEQAQRGGYGGYTGGGYSQGGYTGGYSGGSQSPYTNPLGEFLKQYENACATLGVSTDTDIYEVKLAYRKMAKQYHPDLNPSPDATEMFQKINAAFEFLSEENIKRYKSVKKQNPSN